MSQEKIYHSGDKRPRDESDEVAPEEIEVDLDDINEEDVALQFVRDAHANLLWGNPQDALRNYNYSLQVFALPIAYYARGLAKFLLGDLNESLADVQTAIDSAECEEARTFWVSEKIAMCGAVGDFPEIRRLSRRYPLEDNPIKGYLELKALVCSDDVSWGEVNAEASRFFDGYSQYTQTHRELYSNQFSWAIRILQKFSLTLSEVEKTEVVEFIKNQLLENIHRILDDHTVEYQGQFFLKELWLEASLRSYLCEFAGLALIVTDPEFHAMATRVRGITFRDNDTLPSVFLEVILQMPLKKSDGEDEAQTPQQEYTAEEIEGYIQQMKLSSLRGSIPDVYNQIKDTYNNLLYGRAADDKKPDWRWFNWSEFFHLLPEFTGKDYRELFLSLQHELVIAQMTCLKTDYLVGQAFVEEQTNLAGLCGILFERYNECKMFMQGRGQVAQRVSRNSNTIFQYELLEKLFVLLLEAIQKLFDSRQENTLELIRRFLVLAERVSVELRSTLNSNDLRKAILWDDNVSSQKVKDFNRDFHQHVTALENFKQVELKIREQEALANSHSLTLLYGKNNLAKKKTVVAIPFAPELSLTVLPMVYDEQKVDSAKNIMVGFVFTLTFSADCDGGRKYYVKHIPIRMSQCGEFLKYNDVARECAKETTELDAAVLKNIREGFEIYQRETQDPALREIKLLAFSPQEQEGLSAARQDSFDPRYHAHSEQSGVFWLLNNLDDIARQLIAPLQADPDFQRNGKLGMLALDMLSDKSSCDSCKLSLLALQASNGEDGFRVSLERRLRNAGVNIANSGLKMGSRIHSRQPYCYNDPKKGDTQKGVNPTEKHVARLKNLGLFQLSHPGTSLMSGNNPQVYSKSNTTYGKG